MPRRNLSPARLKPLINWHPPFLFSGIQLLAIADAWSHARVRLKAGRFNRNHVCTHFGGRAGLRAPQDASVNAALAHQIDNCGSYRGGVRGGIHA